MNSTKPSLLRKLCPIYKPQYIIGEMKIVLLHQSGVYILRCDELKQAFFSQKQCPIYKPQYIIAEMKIVLLH